MVEGVEVVVVGNVVRDDLGVHQVALALLADLVQRLRGRKKLEMPGSDDLKEEKSRRSKGLKPLSFSSVSRNNKTKQKTGKDAAAAACPGGGDALTLSCEMFSSTVTRSLVLLLTRSAD